MCMSCPYKENNDDYKGEAYGYEYYDDYSLFLTATKLLLDIVMIES